MVIYLGRARPERLLDELINELQTIETMSCLVERTETPPFFRVTSLRKVSSHWGESEATVPSGAGLQTSRPEETLPGVALGIEKGTIHTKRHSSEDPGLLTLSASSSALTTGKVSPRLDRSRSHNDDMGPSKKQVFLEEQLQIPQDVNYEMSQPHPLPMPEYGGYFAPLTEFLPDSSQPVNSFHR